MLDGLMFTFISLKIGHRADVRNKIVELDLLITHNEIFSDMSFVAPCSFVVLEELVCYWFRNQSCNTGLVCLFYEAKTFPPLVCKKSRLGHSRPPPPSFSLISLKTHKSEVYKGFHSTSPNFTPLPEIMCVCDESHPSAVQSRAGLSDCLVPVRGCLLYFPLWTGLKLRCDIQGQPSSHSLSCTRV